MTNEPPAGLKSNMRRCLVLEPLNDPKFWEDPTSESEPATQMAKDKKVSGSIAVRVCLFQMPCLQSLLACM
jgi:hypothetical protein